jgi:hypothetical protein
MERTVYVDSNNRDTAMWPHGGQYVLHLTDVVRNVSRVDLVAAKVPNTLFNLNSGSNVLTITGVSGLSNVSVSPGFYSAYGIQAELGASSNLAVGYQYLPDEGKFLLYANTAFTVTVNSGELGKMLGLSANTVLTGTASSTWPVYVNNQTYAGAYLIKSSQVVDFTVNEFVFLDIEELRTPTALDAKAMTSSGTYSGASARRSFAAIQMDVGSGCVKNFKECADYRVSVFYPEPINSIDRLTIGWYDKEGRLLDFAGGGTSDSNAFFLRFYTSNDRPELPPPPAVTEVEVKRIIEAMTLLPPPEKKEKKKKGPGRWVYVLVILALVALGFTWSRRTAPATAPLPLR